MLATLTQPIMLASGATIRRRIFGRFALGQDSIDALTQEIAELRVAAYEGRLTQIADAMGLDVEPSLTDSDVLNTLHQDARGSALSVIHTHNDDLRAFLAQQPKGLSQADLAARVRQWEADRQAWKSQQIVVTEGYGAANAADGDVLSRNRLQIERRLTPSQAEEELCARLVQRGWMKPSEIDFDLPVHPHCQHRWSYRQPLDTAVAGKSRVWLGDWHHMSTQLSVDDDTNEDEPESDTTPEDETPVYFGWFNPQVHITRHDLGGGALHRVRHAGSGAHVGTVVTRHKTHTAVLADGRLSEHATLDDAIRHMAAASGIEHVEGV